MLGKAWRKRLAAVLIFMCMGLTACGVRTLPLWESAQVKSYEYGDGDRYEGEVKAGKKEGTGTYYFAEGSYYRGEWKDDMINDGM